MRDANKTGYWGTVVPNPATASPGGLPVMEWCPPPLHPLL